MCVLIKIVLLSWCFVSKSLANDDLELDLNDILNDSLMPSSLLMIDVPSKDQFEYLMARPSGAEIVDRNPSNSSAGGQVQVNGTGTMDGSFNEALSTMRFHRKMFNEYMCSNFVANEILSNILPGVSNFSHRLGIAPVNPVSSSNSNNTEEFANKQQPADVEAVNQNVLFDQGSSGYQNWLKKTSTLDDIFHHHMKPPQSENTTMLQPVYSTSARRNDVYGDTGQDVQYFEGEVSGYAVQKPIEEDEGHMTDVNANYNYNTPALQNPHMMLNDDLLGRRVVNPSVETKDITLISQGYQATASSGFVQFPPDIVPPLDYSPVPQVLPERGYYASAHEEYPIHDTKSHKSMGLKEIFEIALTTLAFLSFGMFILQVIMCITMEKPDNNMMMMPMEGMEGDEIDTGTEEIRKRRSISSSRFNQINELSRMVLMSIESTYSADKDNGQCLYKTLCENNKMSRKFDSNQKLWIPLWSLGMTWYSPKVIKNQPRMNSILDGIKASILGLGDADCAKMYQRCNFVLHNKEKEKFRQKRSVKEYKLEW